MISRIPYSIQCIAFLCLLFIVSYTSVLVVLKWAVRRTVFDIPNGRSSHDSATPLGGGIAIVFITLIGGSLAFVCTGDTSCHWMPGYLLGGVLIALVSWMDDVKSQSTAVRLVTHSLGALLAVLTIGYVHRIALPTGGVWTLGWAALPFTLLWIIGLTNVYNFMDGIDGLAGGQSVVACLGWLIFGMLSHERSIVFISLLVGFSSLGFLCHNWSPARIFMGDVGSTFLGYSFAVFTVVAAQIDSRMVVVGALFVWPFIFDAAVTLVQRCIQREKLFLAHRTHLYQKMVRSGLDHGHVAMIYIQASLIGVALALTWYLKMVRFPLMVAILPPLCLGLWKSASMSKQGRPVIQGSDDVTSAPDPSVQLPV